MALVVKDRVKETTATTGTGTLTLAGAMAGFQAFSAALSDGDTTYYALFESSTGAWEVGLGTFALGSATLARTTILASSNAGSAINLTAGNAEVFITQPAGKTVVFDASGDLTLNQDPTSALQAATKQYVDTIAAAGVHYHDPVRVESPVALNATYNNGTAGVGATLTNAGTQAALVIDGVTVNTSDRVLIYVQTNSAHNGVYTVTDTGSASTNWVLTRATDADSYGPSDPDSLGQGDAFFVREGDTGAGELYVMNTEGTITFGTTAITFSQIASTAVYSAGAGLTLTGTTFAVGAGTGVTVNANDVSIGQDVSTSADVTFNTVTADLIGNADTATTASGVTANSVALGTDTTGNYVAAGAVSGNGLSGSASSEGATFTVTSNATNANTPSTIVFRDASGNFSAGTITANLSGNATTATTATTANSVAANSVALGTDTTGNYVATIATNAGLDGSGSSEGAAVTLSLNLNELTTSTSNGDGNFFVVVDSVGTQRKLTKANINISGFNNDAGYTTNVGDITGVTAGSFITGGGTSGTVTINVDATSANTASKVVARDASGNFSAGTITAALSGNASTASALQTARNIALTGAVTGNANFDGSGNISIATTATADPTLTLSGDASGSATFTNLGNATLNVTVANDSHTHNKLIAVDDRDMKPNTSGISGGDKAIRAFFSSKGGMTGTGNADYHDVLVLDTYSDASGGGPNAITFDKGNSAGDPEAYLWKGEWNGTTWGTGQRIFADNYHPNADKWTTARTLSLSGDASGSVSWDGSANATLSVTVANDSHTHLWSNIVGNTRQNYSAAFRPANSTDYAGFQFYNTAGSNAGYFLISGSGVDNTTYQPDGVTLVTDSGWLSLVSRTTTNTGVRISTGATPVTRMTIADAGNIDFNGVTTINTAATNLLNVYNTTNAGGAGINFSDNTGQGQTGQITFYHSDSVSPGSAYGATFKFTTNQPNQAVVLESGDYFVGTNKVWHAGNDGSGSGLDADLWDGNQFSSYLNQAVLTTSSPTFSSVYVANNIIHSGDTNTYMGFHAEDQWRVVTGNVERFEINNSDVTVQSALKEKYVALSGTAPSIDVDAGGAFSLTTSGNTTFTFTAFNTNLSCGFILQLTAGGAHTITWPASVDWAGGITPEAPASGETDIYVFWSRNGGTTWYGVRSLDAAA